MLRTLGIDKDSCYRHGLMIYTWTHGIDNDSCYRHVLMVLTMIHVIYLNSWYRIGTIESHTYERAECCPYAGFCIILYIILVNIYLGCLLRMPINPSLCLCLHPQHWKYIFLLTYFLQYYNCLHWNIEGVHRSCNISPYIHNDERDTRQ